MSSQLGEPGGCTGFSMNQGLTRVTLLFKVDVTMFPASSPQGPFISFFIVLFFSKRSLAFRVRFKDFVFFRKRDFVGILLSRAGTFG